MKRIGEGKREAVRQEGVRSEMRVVRKEHVMSEGVRKEESEGAIEEKIGAVSDSHTAEPVQIPDCSTAKDTYLTDTNSSIYINTPHIGGSVDWLKLLLCPRDRKCLAYMYTHGLVEPTAREGGEGNAGELLQW